MSSFYNCDKENIIISNRFKSLTSSNRRFNKYYVSHDKLNTLTKLPSNTKDRHQCGRIAEISVFYRLRHIHTKTNSTSHEIFDVFSRCLFTFAIAYYIIFKRKPEWWLKCHIWHIILFLFVFEVTLYPREPSGCRNSKHFLFWRERYKCVNVNSMLALIYQ